MHHLGRHDNVVITKYRSNCEFGKERRQINELRPVIVSDMGRQLRLANLHTQATILGAMTMRLARISDKQIIDIN